MNYIIVRKENLTFSLLTNTWDWRKYVTAEYFGKFKEVEKWERKKKSWVSTRPCGNYYTENNVPDSALSYTQAVICFFWSLWKNWILFPCLCWTFRRRKSQVSPFHTQARARVAAAREQPLHNIHPAAPWASQRALEHPWAQQHLAPLLLRLPKASRYFWNIYKVIFYLD